MFPWASWSPWQGRDKDEEDPKKQQNMAEGPRQPRGVGYYQRSKTEELSTRARDPVDMDGGKAQYPGRARREGSTPHIPLQVEDEEVGDDWEKVEHEHLEELKAKHSGKASSQLIPATQEPSSQEEGGLDESYTALDQALKDNQELQRKQADALKRVAELEKRNQELKATVARKEGEVIHLRSELTASSGPASTLSADSERYFTPHTSLTESVNEHRGLAQTGAADSDALLRLQTDNEAKDDTIKSLEQEVSQLKIRLKYAQQLEDQNVRLITEESKHEEENHILRREVESLKRRASVSRPLTRSYAQEQKLQELAQRYEQQYHEEVEENSRLRGKISQLEKEVQEQEEGTTRIDEVDDPELNVELKQKEQLHVHTLRAQVEALKQHSKVQSRQILQLKQELEAVKLTGEEIDTSWRDMVDQLEEENKNLSRDVGALHRDRKFMEKSMEATKAKLEEVQPLSQKLKAQLEEMKQKEEWARRQLESTTENSRKIYQKCRELQDEKKQFSEQFQKLSGLNNDNVTLVNELKAQVRKLEQEKETLQNEVQIAKTEAQLYMEDFESERSDREVAHGKIADYQKKYAHDVGELKAQLAQMEEDISHHRDRLAEVELVYQRREKEMRSVLQEAANNQTEVQAKTSQVKQYKKQVDSLKDQVAELTGHNEDLIQEMGKVMTGMEKLKKAKKKPSDADDPSKLSELEGRNKELEGRNKELLKERDKLFRELDKTRKELTQAKTKVEAEKQKDAKKVKKEAKKKLSDKGVTSPEATEASRTLENRSEKQQSYEELQVENDTLREELEYLRRANEDLKTLFTHGPKNLPLAQSRESSQSPLTSPVVDPPRASVPGQQPPRILEEDEEIEQEKIKQTLDSQFHRQRQLVPFQSMEEQTAGAGMLAGRAVLIANAPPVQYAHEQAPPFEYFHERPPPSGFEAQLNVHSGADIGPALVQLNDQQPPPPRPPKPSPTPPTMSPSGSEVRQLPPPHASGPQGRPTYNQQTPQDSSHLGAPGIVPQRRTYPQTPPEHHWNESHRLSSQYPLQTEVPHQNPIPKQRSVGRDFEQWKLRSPTEGQFSTDQHSLSAAFSRVDPTNPDIQQNPMQSEMYESYEGGRRLDQNLESIIHAQARTVATEVGDESSRRLTMHHIPYDPNLTCPMCNKQFRMGEIQKYRAHVNKQCVGSQGAVSDV